MVWSFPPINSTANDQNTDHTTNSKIFYNGKPAVFPHDFLNNEDETKQSEYLNENPNVFRMPLRIILQNIGIALNNIIHDMIHGNSNILTTDDRLLYFGLFLIILGGVSVVILLFLQNLTPEKRKK